ncbi:hypothetical protein SAMN04487996_112213 [Dyadobacter soli]|uniref:Uncharacterized protein n=1 Tax=Dyadobacter soli TaxID=659014 RepID=A0A1G7NZA7_9BACT|nr:hypothetical protein SAMN04487996_112213 [Dyadobacter soli]
MTELNVDGKTNAAENWITEDELKQRYPKLWMAAKEKINRLESIHTPELREQLRRLRGR